MNNTPSDIYNEIHLFQDTRRCTIDGVTNLTAFFSPLIKEFQQLRKSPNFDMTQFKKLAERVTQQKYIEANARFLSRVYFDSKLIVEQCYKKERPPVGDNKMVGRC